MTPFGLEIPPHVARVIRHLPPDVKHRVKEALRALVLDPNLGEPLSGELSGLWRYRVRRYRIIYALNRQKRGIQLYAVGHRRDIYSKR